MPRVWDSKFCTLPNHPVSFLIQDIDDLPPSTKDFSKWRNGEFVSKCDRHSRKFILKLIFILGPRIKDSKPITKETWEDLRDEAHVNRLNVEDVACESWDNVRMLLNHWWKNTVRKNHPEKPEAARKASIVIKLRSKGVK